ncbi:Integral membrane protein [Candidatus Terasakiella magnetica]|uniref:Integral membrane protein n=1 Tax=Candidatus Terasakiella magnetica TaxID=1867952 RepID=A0A1C3RC90_9PROT|nr:EamA family transporter [Candidatus Terasakiella magnetica]SCA54896.1 Integral membrane protein [Candidatus Terasakiella magnetica]
MNFRDTLQALCVVIIWGFNFAAIKVSVTSVPPLTLTIIRFAITALLLLPFFRLSLDQIKKTIPIALVLGVGHFGLFFVGFQGADAATVALLLQLGVPFSSILAAVFFADKLGWKRSIGMSLAFCGAAFLAGEPQGGTVISIICVIACAFSWAWANILIKKANDIPPLAIMGWMSLFAIPVLLMMSYMWESNQIEAITDAPIHIWLLLSYTILASSVLAYHLWYSLIKRLDVNQVVPFTLLAPMIGVGAGVFILGEEFTLYKMAGGILTLTGVAIIQFRQIKKAKQA